MTSRTIRVDGVELTINASPELPEEAVHVAEMEPGRHLVTLRFSGARSGDDWVALSWNEPLGDATGFWHPAAVWNRSLRAPWTSRLTTSAIHSAPVSCLFGADGRSRATFALSETMRPVEITAGVEEHGDRFGFHIGAPAVDREVCLLLDHRRLPYERCLADVVRWWESLGGMAPAPVPELARTPAYSTWYSMGKAVTAAEVERQAGLAGPLGMGLVIVDDGWHTSDDARDYSSCGDWEPAADKFPDVGAHVAALREQGLGCMLWLALPLVGEGTRTRRRFESSLLGVIQHRAAAVLDPRHPQVRRHCVELCERVMRDWSLDGIKIDFLDIFSRFEQEPPGAGADCASVSEAAGWLVAEIGERMRQVNPLALLEFRQQYTGPRMRAAAAMFRAGDCPGGGGENRLRTLDLRLLSGRSAVHSDMLLWSPAASAETAAVQLIDVLFSVPQISVRLDRVPPAHLEALRFWLRFWNERRPTLLDGELKLERADLLYPAARARGAAGTVVAVYDDRVVELGPADPAPLAITNAGPVDRVVVHTASALAVDVRDCRGQPVGGGRLEAGLNDLRVPVGGVALAEPA